MKRRSSTTISRPPRSSPEPDGDGPGLADWSDWTPLGKSLPFTPASLAETLDGGQAFRWKRGTDDCWEGLFDDLIVRIRLDSDGRLNLRLPTALDGDAARDKTARYFGIGLDWGHLVDALPWRSDPHLRRAIGAFPGLRILRQPIEETLLGFLCSATKRIIQIRQMCALLALRAGTEILSGVHRLPTFSEIANLGSHALEDCLLGFRARYILGTARFLADRPGWLQETAALPYAEAKDRLMQLPGVGEKVADCVLLFGAGKLEAFPVDTWISQTLSRRYALDGFSHRQLATFGRIHFGPSAGLAQQFLFSWERRLGGESNGDPSGRESPRGQGTAGPADPSGRMQPGG